MTLSSDQLYAIAAIIAAIGAVTGPILTAILTRGTQRKVDAVHDQVATVNGKTIGQIADDVAADRVTAAHDGP